MIRRLVLLAAAALALPAAGAQRFELRTVAVGRAPERILPEPSLGLVFVAVVDDERVVALDARTDVVAAVIPTGGRPYGLAFDRARNRLLVVMPNRVAAYEPAGSSFSLVAETPTPLLFPSSTLFDPVADRLLISDYLTVGLGYVAGATFTFDLVQSPPLDQSWQLLLDQPTRQLFAPEANGNVRVYLADPLVLRTTVASASRVHATAYDAARDRLFTVSPQVPSVHAIDLAAGTDWVIPVGQQPWTLAFDPVLDAVFAGNAGSPFVSRLDAGTLQATHVALPAPARTVVLDPDHARLYAVDNVGAQVSVVDAAAGRFVAAYAVGAAPRYAAVDPVTHRLYTADNTGNTVSILGPLADPAASEVWAVPGSIPADGTSRALVTVRPRDASGNLLGPGHRVSIAATAGTLIGTVADAGTGDYTQEIVSGTLAETAIVTAEVDGVTLATRPRVSFRRPGYAELIESQPEWGYTAGGLGVTLLGTGFATPFQARGPVPEAVQVQVRFGGVDAVVLGFTDTQITCLTPPHPAGLVDVSVVKWVDEEPRESVLRGGFTYVDAALAGEPLRAVKSAAPGELRLTWSGGPSGPATVERAASPDFQGDVTATPGIVSGALSETAPAQPGVFHYRVVR